MTWIAQVGHIVMKDARHQRGSLLAYVAVVAAATASALGWLGSFPLLGSMMPGVVGMGLIQVALLIQADSPVRSDAFWATRPFYPSAMVAAKVVYTLAFIIAIPTVGQLVALQSNGLAAGQLSSLVASSVRVFGMWVLVAMVIASLTRDLRSFAVALALGVVGLLFAAVALLPRAIFLPDGGLGAWLWPIGVVGALSFITALYRTRDEPRRFRIAGAAIVGCLLLSIFLPSAPAVATPRPHSDWTARRTRGVAEAASIVDDQLRVELVHPVGTQPMRELGLRLRIDGKRHSDRFSLTSASVDVHLLNGTTLTIPVGHPLIVLHGSLPVADSAQRSALSLLSRPSVDVSVQLNADQAAAIASGIRGMTVAASASVERGYVRGTLPLDPKAAISRNNLRVRVGKAVFTADDILLDIETPSVNASTSWMLQDGGRSTEFVLVNERLGQVARLFTAGTRATRSSLVLPGVRTTVASGEYKLNPGTTPRDAAWLRASRLMVVQWMPHASYPVRAEVAVK